MVVRQPAIVVREGGVENSRRAALRLRELLPSVDVDRCASWGLGRRSSGYLHKGI